MKRNGFALLEILVVVAIIALFAGGGLYLKYFQQSENAAQVGTNAVQQAQQVRQLVNTETSGEQSVIDQLAQNPTSTPAKKETESSSSIATNNGTSPNATPPPAVTTTTIIPTTPPAAPPTLSPINITAKSIVGLQCYFNVATGSLLSAYSGPNPGQAEFESTGVIINPAGYILTAKHVVDETWAAQVYASSSPGTQVLYSDLIFDHCDVGVPPTDALPTAQDIESINPAEALGPMHYKAGVYFDPSQGTMSLSEFQQTDFAILKINGAAQYCSSAYSDCSFSGPFPYSPVLLSSTPPVGDQMLTYGYPVEASEDYYFQMFLKGAVGHLTSYDGGDTYFKNIPFVMNLKADDVMGGRSGSPVYWNGYVTGILYERNTTIQSSTAIGIPAIQKVLEDNGMGNLLKTN